MHNREMLYLEHVAEIFGIPERCFERIKMSHVKPDEQDPYTILEAERSHERQGAEKPLSQAGAGEPS